MPPSKASCPTCARTVTVLASGEVRRHKPPIDAENVTADAEGWCPGGVPPGETNVVAIAGRRRGGTRKAHELTPAEKAEANGRRPASAELDRNGYGACGAKLRQRDGSWDGKHCSNAKGQGTDHLGFGRCQKHGGRSPNGKKHAALERARYEAARVRTAMTFYGRRVAVDPEQALLEEMQRSVGVVRWLEQAIAEWGQFERLAAEMDALDPAKDNDEAQNAAEELIERLAGRARKILDGEAVTEGVSHEDERTGLPSLVAVHSTDRAVGFTDTEYRAWLKVYQEERRHLAAVAKACIEANIAERRQSVLEARAEMIRSLVVIALRIAGVQTTEERALEIVAEATRAVAKELPA